MRTAGAADRLSPDRYGLTHVTDPRYPTSVPGTPSYLCGVLVQPGTGKDLRLCAPPITDPTDLTLVEPEALPVSYQKRQVSPAPGPAPYNQQPLAARRKSHRPWYERQLVLVHYGVFAEVCNPQPGAG
jgi:hypothetical protein